MGGPVLESVAAGIALFVVLHVTIWRAAPSNAPRILLLGLLAGVGTLTSVGVSVATTGASANVWIALWIDSFIFVCYAFVYAGVARSVSVTLLGRVRQAGARPLQLSTLADEYAESSRFEDRLDLMHRSGLVAMSGDVVTITPHGHRVARWTERASRAIASRMEG